MIEKEKMEIKQSNNVVVYDTTSHFKSYLTREGEEVDELSRSYNGSTKFVASLSTTTDFCQNLTPNETRVFVNKKDMEGSYFVQGKRQMHLLFCFVLLVFCCCCLFPVFLLCLN